MKTIQINSITLENFKGQTERKTVEFAPDGITIIEGVNYSGKTTVLDAVTWCLFGKTLLGDTRFGIEPIDKPDAVPEVKLVLTVDGEQHELVRRNKNGKADCLIDEIPKPVKTFEAWVDVNILPIERFKMFSNPLQFASLNWKDQRDIFTSFFQRPSNEAIQKALQADNKKLSAEYTELIGKRSPLDIAVKAKADKQRMENEQRADEAVANDLTEKIAQQDDTPVDKLRAEYAELEHKQQNYAERQKEEAAKRQVYYDKERDVRELEANLKWEKDKFEREQQQKKEAARVDVGNCRFELEKQGRRWEELLKAGYSDTCPTCGQGLPKEDAEKNKQLFEDKKAQIAKAGQAAREELNKAEAELKQVEKSEPLTSTEIMELQDRLNKAKKELAGMEKPKSVSPLDEGAQQHELRTIQNRMSEIQSTLARADRLEQDKKQREQLIKAIQQRGKLIEGAERLISDAETWQAYESKVTVDQVNKRFNGVSVELFEDLKNGNARDTFKLYWKGRNYQDASSTEKVLIGLEINNFLKEALQVSVPTIIDNFESYSSIGYAALPKPAIVTIVTNNTELEGYVVEKI